MLVPDLSGSHPHIAISCSKLNSIYIIDRDNMGQIGSSGDDALQRVDGQLGGSSGTQTNDKCFSTPAFWNNNLYFIGNNDIIKQFTLDPSTGLMSTTPASQNTFAFRFPGGQPSSRPTATATRSCGLWIIRAPRCTCSTPRT